MVTELVIFRVYRGHGPRFEDAFAGVVPLLAGADGYLGHRFVPTLDEAGLYLLQVEWRDLAAHTRGFEPSAAHDEFMAALEPMLLAEPVVVHVPLDTRSRIARSEGADGGIGEGPVSQPKHIGETP